MKNSAMDRSRFSDRMVGVVDRIRRRIHNALGTRPWRVEIVTRSWSGGDRGIGTPKDQVLVLDPVPCVERVTRSRQGPAGSEAEGELVLTEVSLRYTQDEVAPPANRYTEVVYRLIENLGTNQKTTYHAVNGAPIPQRGDKAGDKIGWYIRLKEVPDLGKYDEVAQS